MAGSELAEEMVGNANRLSLIHTLICQKRSGGGYDMRVIINFKCMSKIEEFELSGLMSYPNDRKPTADEYKTPIKTDEEFLEMGPKFTAYYLTEQSKTTNQGEVDVGSVRSQLLAIFCYNRKLSANDEALRYFDDLARKAYVELR
jgi:hypothetical protein